MFYLHITEVFSCSAAMAACEFGLDSLERNMSLDDIQIAFRNQIGHNPHTVKQLLTFVKQQQYPYKFKDIKAWWPSRPNPEEKPVEKAVNADEYKGAHVTTIPSFIDVGKKRIERLFVGYIRELQLSFEVPQSLVLLLIELHGTLPRYQECRDASRKGRGIDASSTTTYNPGLYTYPNLNYQLPTPQRDAYHNGWTSDCPF